MRREEKTLFDVVQGIVERGNDVEIKEGKDDVCSLLEVKKTKRAEFKKDMSSIKILRII